MYNSDRKQAFIETRSLSEGDLKRYIAAFNRIGIFEIKWDCDVSMLPADKLQEVFNDTIGVRGRSYGRIKILTDYLRWCSINCPDAIDNLSHVIVSTVPKKKVKTVSNPLQLQTFLDAICEPEDAHTADNVLRAYLWLAFAGVPVNKVCNISIADVNLSALSIEHDGRRYPIYKEGINAIKNCIELQAFIYIREGNAVAHSRFKSNLLLRGVRANPKNNNLLLYLRRATTDALNQGVTTKEVTYTSALLSGRCYRLYELEMAGIPIKWDKLADDIIADEGFKGNLIYKSRSIKQSLKKDYLQWKQALLGRG